MKPLTIGLVGCGAVAELYYAPALRALEQAGRINVTALTDRDARRLEQLGNFFPGAQRGETLPTKAVARLAIVATPARWHAEQASELLRGGVAVLCEKPMANTVAEAEQMIATARASGALLAVGLFRRFFPALQMIEHFQRHATFGPLRRFAIEEGGPFNWPAATASFFDPRQTGGGVLLDVGVHVLDVLDWWLGEPAAVQYTDDAAGGMEAVCRLELRYRTNEHAVDGSVLLSRDWKTSNTWTLEFERATVVWRVGEANRLETRPAGATHWCVSHLETENAAGRRLSDTYQQAFTRQILDVVESIEEARPPRVSGAAALPSLRLIERCYREREPLFPKDLP